MISTSINMDKRLIRVGGRKSVEITEDELLDIIFDVHQKEEPDDYENEDKEYFDESDVNLSILKCVSKLEKDLSKIRFDSENFNCCNNDEPESNLIGLHTLENGLTFLGGMAGGDWEIPVFIIIYWDGSSLRGYIPMYGNTIDLDFKCAFGSEEDTSISNIEKTLKKYGFPGDSTDDIPNNFYEIYAKAQGIDKTNNKIVVNFDAIKEDIINRIQLT